MKIKTHKILVLGNGFMGQRIQDSLACALSAKRINSYQDIESLIEAYQPKVIINAIGYVGKKNVDDCEKDVDKTIKSNTFVPLLLGEMAYRRRIKLVHISTGCLYHFDYKFQNPITELAIPDSYDLYYSRTKIYVENVFRELEKRCNILTLRIRIPLDDRPHPKNILTKLLGFRSVLDNPNSVTYVPDFLEALKYLIHKDARGLFNVTLKGGLYYAHLLKEYQRRKEGFTFKAMKLKDFKLTRTNLLLSTRKLEKIGFKVRTPKEIYKECVKNYLQSS